MSIKGCDNMVDMNPDWDEDDNLGDEDEDDRIDWSN